MNRGILPAVLLLVGSIALHACGSSSGRYHVVAPGDSLWAIGKKFAVDYASIACANRIADPSRLQVGRRLVIPADSSDCAPRPVQNDRQAMAPVPRQPIAPRGDPSRPTAVPASAAMGPVWPVDGGRVTSPFGPRGRSPHEGIDISAPVGTPVHAADRGVVAFSGVMRGYGNMIVVRHPDGHSTVYAHNRTNWARKGSRVRRGEVIAAVGSTGRTTGANLHFEVWRDGQLRDPAEYLAASWQDRASVDP